LKIDLENSKPLPPVNICSEILFLVRFIALVICVGAIAASLETIWTEFSLDKPFIVKRVVQADPEQVSEHIL